MIYVFMDLKHVFRTYDDFEKGFFYSLDGLFVANFVIDKMHEFTETHMHMRLHAYVHTHP